MEYVILYSDGSYEADVPFASGWPTLALNEAKTFSDKIDAELHCENLIDAHVIEKESP